MSCQPASVRCHNVLCMYTEHMVRHSAKTCSEYAFADFTAGKHTKVTSRDLRQVLTTRARYNSCWQPCSTRSKPAVGKLLIRNFQRQLQSSYSTPPLLSQDRLRRVVGHVTIAVILCSQAHSGSCPAGRSLHLILQERLYDESPPGPQSLSPPGPRCDH